jgi:hypothetical protein
MTEDFLHYIWSQRLYYPLLINTLNGKSIEVLETGEMNVNSGPDFFNAIIRMEDMVLAGNVEIHLNASDWFRHGHHNNKAYDSVILQVVLNRDAEVKRTNGETIPTAEIRFDDKLLDTYRQLLGSEFWIPCQPYIAGVDAAITGQWLEKLALKRLGQKALIIKDIFHQNQNSWEESIYQLLARNFGFSLNNGAFEALSRSLPYRLLQKHRDNIFQLEALLFGQAGFLNGDRGDDYFCALKKEFHYLKGKYRLKPIDKHLWKFLRLRPANFPTVRIAQFASFIHQTPFLFSSLMETRDIKNITALFNVSASGYWDTHFVFNKPSVVARKNPGVFAIKSVMINSVAPLLYFYGLQRGMHEFRERALKFLKELPAENNLIISKWRGIGVQAESAFISQALLQQKNEFCAYKRCLNCRIGNFIIKNL